MAFMDLPMAQRSRRTWSSRHSMPPEQYLPRNGSDRSMASRLKTASFGTAMKGFSVRHLVSVLALSRSSWKVRKLPQSISRRPLLWLPCAAILERYREFISYAQELVTAFVGVVSALRAFTKGETTLHDEFGTERGRVFHRSDCYRLNPVACTRCFSHPAQIAPLIGQSFGEWTTAGF
jgi:hypothetical protein